MRYRASTIDRDLQKQFINENICAHLKSIELIAGELRSINSLSIKFEYPITVFAGKNGVGKSTILAMACCAYHNSKKGYKNPKRQTTYYTFSDFFVQHRDEVPPQGIRIRYGIAYNNWRRSESAPTGEGLGYQDRYKKRGGKWNDYDTRVIRNVAFLGIERIVPHVERSQSRSYSKAFKEGKPKGWEEKVKNAVGYILGRNYDEFGYHEYSKYTLPVVRVGDVFYSGLNMGAGENALFEIFTAIYACGRGGLVVMDEIELGLHAEAQTKLIKKLKDACLEMHTQIVCTTHSRQIFSCLPPRARIFVEEINGKTVILPGISDDYAFAKLAGIVGNELRVYVEDNVAEAILNFAIPASARARIEIRVIGSATCVSRQLASAYVVDQHIDVIAVYDGDQKTCCKSNLDTAAKSIECKSEEFCKWFSDRVCYIPGDGWPESWLFEMAISHATEISPSFRMGEDQFIELCKEALRAGKHNEFYTFASKVGFDSSVCLNLIANSVCLLEAAEFADLEKKILAMLE